MQTEFRRRFLGLLATILAALVSPLDSNAEDASIPRPEHPTPQAVREHWANLNGPWAFRFDPEDVGLEQDWFEPEAEGFDQTIQVPFCWESELSGIGETDGPEIGWYRRSFRIPEDFPEDAHIWIRFGAVDERADVWVNGEKVAEHNGGYTPFEADITEAIGRDGENVVVVRAFDPTDPSHPTGKQIGWYTTTSGIWQTVWLEARPATHISDFFPRTTLEPAEVTVDVTVAGPIPDGGLTAVLTSADEPTVNAEPAPVVRPPRSSRGALPAARVVAQVADPIPWSPDNPKLYDAVVELRDTDGETVDRIQTYFGLRTIERRRLPGEEFERILLNGEPIEIRSALDQSFYPDGIYTASSDEAIRFDLEQTKALGLNGLRIHIKTDEPRKLYWADRLGVLIMQDMPNTWAQNPEARATWEATMREAVARDRNHPSLWSWVAFNETWGLENRGGPRYAEDPDTQAWVQRMVATIRALDPTRLVEDNSPNKYDHVPGTDLNTWHFYIDDAEVARRHIEEVVEQTHPGSPFNYVPGAVQATEPLMNSEYGAVSAGGGDRDISWGFRYLTTFLREHENIQGYVYTELTDIEWEHNGFLDYDRSPKTYGYAAFLPNMELHELNGADFIGFRAPPAIVARPGETVTVPVFVRHGSDRDFTPTFRWWAQGWNDEGGIVVPAPSRHEPFPWERHQVVWRAEPITLTMPERPFVGALNLTLRHPETNDRIAANFVNLVVQPEEPLPRLERSKDREAILRFRPEDYARGRWDEPADAPPGKVYGRGAGFFEYRLQVPEAVVNAKPEWIYLTVEAASKADRELVDWPERVNPQDYPQTETDTWPSTLQITFNGRPFFEAPQRLPNDPADARGVLSHLRGVEHGSHGELLQIAAPVSDGVLKQLQAGEPLVIRFEVPEDAPDVGGLTIFGAETGAFPIDPTLELNTAEPLPEDLGATPSAPVAIDTVESRRQVVLPDGRSEAPAVWSFTTEDPGLGWTDPGFDQTDWPTGPAGFGARGTPGIRIGTRWNTPEIWLRTEVDLPSLGDQDVLTIDVFHDEDIDIFVNGESIFAASGYVTGYQSFRLDAEALEAFRPGRNRIAAHCRQTGGGQGVDVGLRLLRAE